MPYTEEQRRARAAERKKQKALDRAERQRTAWNSANMKTILARRPGENAADFVRRAHQCGAPVHPAVVAEAALDAGDAVDYVDALAQWESLEALG